MKRLFAFLVICAVAPVHAVPVVFDFTGTLTAQTGVFDGQGTVVSGSLGYDTDMFDSFPGSTGFDRFESASNCGRLFFMSVTVGSISRSVSTTCDLSAISALIQVDQLTGDEWAFQVFNANDLRGNISLFAAGVFPFDLYGPGDGNLTNTPVAPTSLDLGVVFEDQSFFSAPDGTIDFTVTSFSSVSAASVTAPIGLACLAVALFATSASRRQRCSR